MLSPATHDLSYNPKKEAERYRRGDVFGVHNSTDIATKTNGVYHLPSIGTKVFGYIHILDIPNARARRMKRVLTRGTGETQQIDILNEIGLVESIAQPDDYRRRQWLVVISLLSNNARSRLISDREITVTWPQFRGKIRKKVVTNRLDVSLDDESGAVTDTDLS